MAFLVQSLSQNPFPEGHKIYNFGRRLRGLHNYKFIFFSYRVWEYRRKFFENKIEFLKSNTYKYYQLKIHHVVLKMLNLIMNDKQQLP